MSDFNYDIIISNIKMLMKNNSITQKNLEEKTNIPQPHISKALNPESKTRFTLEQIIAIADYFKVSIDFLIGRVDKVAKKYNSSKEICLFLKELVESNSIDTIENEVEETVYISENPEKSNPQKHKSIDTINKYTSFYFSEYESLSDYPYDDYKLKFFNEYGNKNYRSEEINEFIYFLLNMHKLYKNSHLNSELYEQAIHDRIENMHF